MLPAKYLQITAAHDWLPILIGLLALYIPTFYDLSTTIWREDEYAHGPIILAVIIWLIWSLRQKILPCTSQTAPIAGTVFIVFGLLLYLLGRSQNVSIFEIGALIPILGGAILSIRGWPALRASWFVLLFIVYLIPLPTVFVDAVTGPLKQHVSSIAEQILHFAGYPIARNGVVLNIGQYQLLVADACSGLNSMFSLSAIGLLYLYTMRYKNWLHNSIMVVSLLPIAFGANVLRVIFLVLVTYHFGDAAGQGFLHGFSGMALFIIALTIIISLDLILVKILSGQKINPQK